MEGRLRVVVTGVVVATVGRRQGAATATRRTEQKMQ